MTDSSPLLILYLLFGLFGGQVFCQVKFPSLPQPETFNRIDIQHRLPNDLMLPNDPLLFYQRQQEKIRRQNQQLMYEIEFLQQQQRIAKFKIDFSLPSHHTKQSPLHFYHAFEELNRLNPQHYSLLNAVYTVENAFLENALDYKEFEQYIQQSAAFIEAKIEEDGYEASNNVAKNLLLFRFFSDTLEVKSQNKKHYPFTYDFEDYRGEQDWTKMFVSKLLLTGSGQCTSLPRLYLILAEEIEAKAHLSFAPNHSFVRFSDENGNWYNVELTNGMFTTDSFVLQSGFIKAEALQQNIYLQELTKEELLSQSYVELASGYIHKFGYDAFVEKVIKKALTLYPKNIVAHMVYANFLTEQFSYATGLVGINPLNKSELQHIRHYPELIDLLQRTNAQYGKIDALGHEHMPESEYQNWLKRLRQLKQQQESQRYKKTLTRDAKLKG